MQIGDVASFLERSPLQKQANRIGGVHFRKLPLSIQIYNFKFPLASPAVVRYNDFVLLVKGRGIQISRVVVVFER